MRNNMNNPGIDLAIWTRLRNKWSDLQKDGHDLKIDVKLLADTGNQKNILAIDVVQIIDGEILTETVQRQAGEAYETLGIAGLSLERLIEAYSEMMHELHTQIKQKDSDLIVIMSPSSPTSGELRGYTESPDSDVKSSVLVNYRH